MEIITQNPYRQIGVYANSPKKDQLANENKLKALLKVGKQVPFPLDLEGFLSPIQRTSESVADAQAKLTLPKDQMRYAQFWFVNVTPLDKVAFNKLTSGDMDGAMEIWGRQNNASSLQNRIVCKLIVKDYGAAISFAEKLYSQYKQPFVTAILGDTALVSTDTLAYDFLDTLSGEVGLNTILPSVTNAEWKSHLSSKAIDLLIAQLQSAVETAKAARGKGPDARRKAGDQLWKDAKPLLNQLSQLLPKSDLKYQTIADKVGTEILQCSVDYYNKSEDDNKAHTAMTMLKHAKTIIVGEMAKDRCLENEKSLQEIIDQLPPQQVMQEANSVMNELNKAIHSSSSISVATTLLHNAKPYLHTIKSKLGSNNAFYLRLSTVVVSKALGNVIKEVNDIQQYNNNPVLIMATFRAAWKATLLMDTFDIEEDFQDHYYQNRSILENICERLNITSSGISGTTWPTSGGPSYTSKDSSSSGCMVTIAIGIILGILGYFSSCSNGPDQKTNNNEIGVEEESYGNTSDVKETMTTKLVVDTVTYDRLATGDKPYSQFYHSKSGDNFIRFKTSGSSDYVVIVKYADNDEVVNHVYIRGGDVTQLYVPNGNYYVYFYSGNGGWNPNKIKGGVRGGFARHETLQKDGPISLRYQDCEYTLYPVSYGNLSLKTADEDEAF